MVYATLVQGVGCKVIMVYATLVRAHARAGTIRAGQLRGGSIPHTPHSGTRGAPEHMDL